MSHTIKSLKLQLQQLKDLADSGVLPPSQYEASRSLVEKRLREIESQGEDGPALPQSRASKGLLLGLGLGIVVLAAAGYAWKGSPGMITESSIAASREDKQEAPHTNNLDAIEVMAERLAARLREQPEDADGWAMLGRSYGVLGRFPQALAAYEKAIALQPNDATLLADYADSLAVASGGDLGGKPLQQINRALKIDPQNLKALFLAGTHAFNSKNYPRAVEYWGKALKSAPPDSPWLDRLNGSLNEARSLAANETTAPKAANANAFVSGTIRLSQALQKNAAPDDTLFVFARPADGSRMPLAILRKQVRDLPLDFKLDDSLAMPGAKALSSARQVIVGARISKSGNAMAQPGDLFGQSETVEVGATSIQFEIRDTVKP
jgi:cytochrome c-type biogenesis protein CcmH